MASSPAACHGCLVTPSSRALAALFSVRSVFAHAGHPCSHGGLQLSAACRSKPSAAAPQASTGTSAPMESPSPLAPMDPNSQLPHDRKRTFEGHAKGVHRLLPS